MIIANVTMLCLGFNLRGINEVPCTEILLSWQGMIGDLVLEGDERRFSGIVLETNIQTGCFSCN